jgi:hypothetical protein
MKWFEKNSIWVVFGFLSLAILFQMWYIMELKNKLRTFTEKEHIVITHVEILGRQYSALNDTIRIKCNDTTSKKIIRKQYSERGILNW